jgi:cytochrome P450
VTRSTETEAGTACPAERDWITSFDHHDAALSRNPYPVYQQLRNQCPVSKTDAWGGFWVVTGHAEVDSVAKNDTDYSSGVVLEDGTIQGVTIPSVGQTRKVIPIELDPPENLKYRKLLNPFYTVQAVRRREDEIRALVDELIDGFIEDGECDLVHSLTLATPAIVTLREVGLPTERWEEFVAWIDTMIHDSGHDPEGAMQAGMAVYGEYLKAIQERRENGLRDDVISTLMSSEIDGEPVTDEEIVDVGILLLFGGLDTTSAASATTFLHLAQNLEIRKRVAADKELSRYVVEEYLRWVSPVQANSRTVTNDVELGGVQLRKGERLLALWAGANHDPAHAPDPDTVNFDRGSNPHMAFGVGSHRCLGAHLARTMFRLMLEEVLERLPDYRVAGGKDVEWFDNISSVYGVKRLPIEFTPGKRRG